MRVHTDTKAAEAARAVNARAFTALWPSFSITTYAQLEVAIRFGIGQLQSDLEGVDENAYVRKNANEWIEHVNSWQTYLEGKGDQPLLKFVVDIARGFYDDFIKIRREIKEEKKAAAVQEMRRAQAKAKEAAAQMEKMRPALDDRLRDAYRAGDESMIREVADIIGTTTDIGMGMHELSRKIAETIAEAAKVELSPVSGLTEILDNFNKGLAVVNLALVITDTKERATELEEGMHAINKAAGTFTALSTLGGLAPHIGLYANLYLMPMVKAIMAQIEHLVDQLHEKNKDWVELSGELMHTEAEPGGEEMFTFMVDIMNANRIEEIPKAIPKGVNDYILENREKLEVGAKSEVPTKFWRRLDVKETIDWIYGHRHEIWAMLYGSWRVPKKKSR